MRKTCSLRRKKDVKQERERGKKKKYKFHGAWFQMGVYPIWFVGGPIRHDHRIVSVMDLIIFSQLLVGTSGNSLVPDLCIHLHVSDLFSKSNKAGSVLIDGRFLWLEKLSTNQNFAGRIKLGHYC